MSELQLNILMLEDDPMDMDLNKMQLKALDEFECNVIWVQDKQSFLNELNRDLPDIILSDYNLPQFSGLDALDEVKKRNLLIPFIFVTGAMNEETAAETIKAGACDYVVKDRISRLPYAIRSGLKLYQEKKHALESDIENKKLQKAVEQSPSHIIILDVFGRVEYVNQKYIDFTGYSSQEVVGSLSNLFNPDVIGHELFIEIQQNLELGRTWRGELNNYKKDGTLYWENNSVAPIYDNSGCLMSYVVIKEDITLQKKMLNAIIDARDKAERSDKLKDVFLQNLSHEIRTPLNAIVGFTNFLGNEKFDAEQQKEFIKIIQTSSNQLLSIVSDVMTASRLQTGQEKLQVKPVVVNDTIKNCITIFNDKISAKGLELKVSLPFDNADSPILLTDETKFIQILSNLLNNALKFTQEGFIEIGYKIEPGNIRFFVSDTGIGVSQDAQYLIFERFAQASESISKDFGGTGLGLSISKSFVEMMGGEIGVNSQVDVGSTFWFTLPYKEVMKLKSEEPNSSSNKDRVAPIKILVVEDECYNYLLLEAILQHQNHTLLYATNGWEGLQIFKSTTDIDIVLMDIRMPVMDGISSMKEMRLINDKIPIVAQTAYALEQDRDNFLSMGFADYIAKPIRQEELIQIIMRHSKS